MDFAIQSPYIHRTKSFALPLFMDVHRGGGFTLEDVKTGHLADLAIQSKYGVRYVQYWVNEKAGRIFCLMEAPNKEACHKVHHEAQGNTACNIIQIEKSDYELLMGVTSVDELELTYDLQGKLDLGYRIFIAVSFVGPEKILIEPKFITGKLIRELEGREVNHSGPEIIGVFNSCKHAVECAQYIQSGISEFLKQQQIADRIEFRIALAAGEPVTENGSMFADALNLVSKLNVLADKNQIILSSLVQDLNQGSNIDSDRNLFKVLTSNEERLLVRLMELAESRLNDRQFDVSYLSRELGISTTQLLKKMKHLTATSPKDFINELRLQKAEKLLRRREESIADVAKKVGFGNTSHFTRCFSKRFGVAPAQYLEHI
jgi:AraC-like DNA-binding protein